MGKIKFSGLLMGGVLFLMSSCLGGNNNDGIDDWILSNAQIATFSLSNDSIEGLSNVKFTIDQINGKIFNKDSMPYGTAINHKVLCALSWDNGSLGVSSALFIPQSTGDSVWWTESDSIDFSAPVAITVYPLDGLSTKVYEAKLNIHQVNPDTMIWHKYASLISGKTFKDMKVISYEDSYYMFVEESGIYRLYKTDMADMINWEEVVLTDFPDKAVLSQITVCEGDLYVMTEDGVLFCSLAGQNPDGGQSWVQVDGIPKMKTLLGCLPENTISGRTTVLSGIADEGGVLYFVSINKNKEYKIGTIVSETFPISGFGGFSYELMYHPRFVICSGRDSKGNLSGNAWSTMDALTWIPLSNISFSPREGAAVSYYDDCFFVIGGIDAFGATLNDIFYSKDHGVSWVNTDYVMAEEYTARGFASVFVDKNNYILLFGGKAGKDENILNELWRGRINRLGFGKD